MASVLTKDKYGGYPVFVLHPYDITLLIGVGLILKGACRIPRG